MRLSTLALLGSLAFSASATVQAQTVYSRFASQADLADGGRLPGVQPRCLTRIFGELIFFDDTSDQIVSYNSANASGSRIEILVSAADLDTIAGTDVTQCRDADQSSVNIVFALSNAANEDLVFSTTNIGDMRRRVATGPGVDGITGVALDQSPGGGTFVYLARSQFFGAQEDGVYFINGLGNDLAVTPLVTNPDLDLVGMTVTQGGDIFATSSENGVGQYQNKVVRISFPQSAPALSIVFDPFAGPNPVFVNGTDGGLEDITVGEQGDVERLFVVNNSFGGPQGETLARFQLDGSNPVVVFTQSALIASPDAGATDASAFTTAGANGYLAVGATANQNGQVSDLYLASTDTNSGQVAIFRLDVTGLPTPGEELAAEAAGLAIRVANPVRGTARVAFETPGGDVRLSVVDMLGREVAVLAEGARGRGDATLDADVLSPGVYLVRLEAAGHVLTRVVTVVR